MLHLLPRPKFIEERNAILKNNSVNFSGICLDERVGKAISKLPQSTNGIPLVLSMSDMPREAYELSASNDIITIKGGDNAGLFYGIQTLRQILSCEDAVCCNIKDCPDMKYRGFYHDVTRGKVPTVETLKELIDNLAYYKMNSLQLYVEHTFEFKEYADSIERTGYLTADEIRELDDYCYDNFIEFIPSLSTFGHLYELLEKPQYKHLREVEDLEKEEMFWHNRMHHHTIDPTSDESFEIIKSLIDQYVPLFRSNTFNICCDETFDLSIGKHKDFDTGKLYIDFVKKIIDYVKSKGKTVMMWADILLQHPECVDLLPDDVIFLNWHYEKNIPVENIEKFSKMNRNQIVCPGTSTWSRLCENIEKSRENISNMIDCGYRNSAFGVLNTNWGDWGNPCSLELAMFGLVLGASKSWNVDTSCGKTFNDDINYLVYKDNKGVEYLTRLDKIHSKIDWNNFAFIYSNVVYKTKYDSYITYPYESTIQDVIKDCTELITTLKTDNNMDKNYLEEMLVACEGIGVMAQLLAKVCKYHIEKPFDTINWLSKYRKMWIKKNKKSEIKEIENMFISLEKL
ncbi:MAG: family 20 glycosylhydrolase [Eubacteriales bacterium]|nr:family 20 glycosylhydrolase [Eubacteriales bacterium]